jgi:TRAP-type C4-dicarboxylate transport system permease small subunit
MKRKNWLKPVENGITSLNKWCSFLAAFFVALIMVIATIDVITVKLFSFSVPAGKNFIAEFNALIVFMAISYVAIERGHIRITIIENRVSAGIAHAFKLLGHALGALTIGFCTWRAMILVLDSYNRHIYKYGALDYPLWPFQLVSVVGFALLAITFIMLFIKEVKSPRN